MPYSGAEMTRDRLQGIIFLGVIITLFVSYPAFSAQKFKLKPGATGEICLTCHVTFKEKLKSAYVHTPVKSGDCSGCHNPHASSHDKLLDADTNKICAKCHGSMIPQNAQSSHKVVAEGNCVFCHDPHASSNKANLVRAGSDLCFGCHADMGDRISNLKFSHSPVKSSCLNCHNPHASDKAKSLLVDGVPKLCLNCHQVDKPVFAKMHMNYPVKDSRCTSCHNPHGSNNIAILYDNVHMPVANKMCDQCHEGPSSSPPFKLKAKGYELCKTCHYDLVNEAFNKNSVHWPLLDDVGCVNCHSPHASQQKKLLLKPMLELCGKCHSDTIARQRRSQSKHVPVAEGNCTACHSPHASDNTFLFNSPSTIDICGTCHDWQKHSTHPIGAKVVDPRNRNLVLQCVSCHRSHGTEYKKMLYFENTSELCTQCHVKYKR